MEINEFDVSCGDGNGGNGPYYLLSVVDTFVHNYAGTAGRNQDCPGQQGHMILLNRRGGMDERSLRNKIWKVSGRKSTETLTVFAWETGEKLQLMQICVGRR